MNVDTEPRTLQQVIERLIVPIEQDFIAVKNDSSKAAYINIVTQKDLLDWACGAGRWRASVKQTIGPIATGYKASNAKEPTIGSMFGIILTLSIQTSDEGWIEQDGTGTEMLTGSPVYGDFLTNAYAQALRRASESFGMARELWRKKIHPMQITAADAVNSKTTDIPATVSDEETDDEIYNEAIADREERAIIFAEITDLYTQMGKPEKAKVATDKLAMSPLGDCRHALVQVQNLKARRLKEAA